MGLSPLRLGRQIYAGKEHHTISTGEHGNAGASKAENGGLTVRLRQRRDCTDEGSGQRRQRGRAGLPRQAVSLAQVAEAGRARARARAKAAMWPTGGRVSGLHHGPRYRDCIMGQGVGTLWCGTRA